MKNKLIKNKELKRRNSIKLEKAVHQQESSPWKAYGYGKRGYNRDDANRKADDIKKSLDQE